MTNNFNPSTPEWAKPILTQLAQKYGIPTEVLSSQINHESGFQNIDSQPNADASKSYDRGIAQINNYWHPEISDAQAHDTNFALDWMARTMAEKKNRLGDWGKALSEYNTGNPNDGFKNGYVNKILGGTSTASSQSTQKSPNLSKSTPLQSQNVLQAIQKLFQAKPQAAPRPAPVMSMLQPMSTPAQTPPPAPLQPQNVSAVPTQPTLPQSPQYKPAFMANQTQKFSPLNAV